MLAFKYVGIELEFRHGLNEIAKVKASKNKKYQVEIGKEVLSVDEHFRPTEGRYFNWRFNKGKK